MGNDSGLGRVFGFICVLGVEVSYVVRSGCSPVLDGCPFFSYERTN